MGYRYIPGKIKANRFMPMGPLRYGAVYMRDHNNVTRVLFHNQVHDTFRGKKSTIFLVKGRF